MANRAELSIDDFMPTSTYDEGDVAPNVEGWTPYVPQTQRTAEPYRPNMTPMEALRTLYEYGPSMGLSQSEINQSNREVGTNILEGLAAYPGYGAAMSGGQLPAFYPREYSRLDLGAVRQGLENIFQPYKTFERYTVGNQTGIRPVTRYGGFSPSQAVEQGERLVSWLQNLPGSPFGYSQYAPINPKQLVLDSLIRGDIAGAKNVYDLYYDYLVGPNNESR